jgi:hypothetical protein
LEQISNHNIIVVYSLPISAPITIKEANKLLFTNVNAKYRLRKQLHVNPIWPGNFIENCKVKA